MTETRIQFQAGAHLLEGLFSRGREEKGAVITHPHPLYGGDMANSVVEAAARVLQNSGFATLRFNFRGVGASQGRYENGIGEREDVRAALGYLRDRGVSKTDLYGYSFGAWVNAHLDCQRDRIDRMVMISPPVNFIAFDEVGPLPCLGSAVVGDADEFADTDRVRSLLNRCNPKARMNIIHDTDHFYSGALKDLEAFLKDDLRSPESG
ncbi:MAG: alpha/beta hydrolase [Thermodesulfobacteriota bacterium]